VRPSDLRTSAVSSAPWLIDQLWTAQAVGIIGGTPKSYKTWMALEMAVAVASGSACLATFAVPLPGPVLLYAAEDSESALRLRLESLVHHHRLDLAYLDIRVITADSLRLDRTADQERLQATLMLHRPVLLILDPLVRLHAIDENAAGEIAILLGYLRLLQRKTGTALALVHHARKNVSASGAVPLALERAICDLGPSLKLTSTIHAAESARDPLLEQILALLGQSSQPRTAESLRSSLQVRNQRLVEALRQLSEQGKVVRLSQGYALPRNSTLPLMMESSSPRVAPR